MEPVDVSSSSVAIVIPCIRVEPFTERCVRECAKAWPTAEIIVVADIGDGRASLDKLARVIVSGRQTIAAKRNLAARHTKVRILAFIDSDAYPGESWLENGIRHLDRDPTLGAAGGPNVSPPDQTGSRRHVGFAQRSVLVSGTANFRKLVRPARHVEHLESCNLFVRREEYLAMGGMDESLVTGEDTEFCLRLIARGRKILYTPDILVYHYNRRLLPFLYQRLTFGAAVIPLLRRRFELSAAAFLFPAIFVVFLASGPVLIAYPPLDRIYLLVVGAYLVWVFVETIRWAERARDLPGTFVALLIGNLVPGVGTIAKALGLLPDVRKFYRNDL